MNSLDGEIYYSFLFRLVLRRLQKQGISVESGNRGGEAVPGSGLGQVVEVDMA